MLLIAPSVINYRVNGSSIACLTNSENPGTAIAALVGNPQSPLLTSDTIIIDDFNDPLVVELPSTISVVTSLRINSQIYTLIPLSVPLQPGQFHYDPITHRLTIALVGYGTIIRYTALLNHYPTAIPTTRIKEISEFFKLWNADGEITLKRQISDHPQLEFQFLAKPTQEESVKSTFTPGAKFTIWGISYIIVAPPSVEYRKSGWLRVKIGLSGEHTPRGLRSPLDTPIKLNTGSHSTSTLLKDYGIPYRGVSTSRKSQVEETTTLRQELEIAALSGFLDYHLSEIEIKLFGQTSVHYLSQADVFSANPTLQSLGTGANYQGITLVKELHNVRLNLEEEEEESSNTNERTTLYKGNPHPEIPPNIDRNLLRSPSLSFDNNGPTQTRTDVTFLNGQPVLEIEQTWGFVYTSLDTHTVTFSNNKLAIRFSDQTFNNYWQRIRYTEKIYNHAYKGYLTGESTNGTEKTRFKAETDELELALLQGEWLQADADDRPAIEAKMRLYQYFDVPISSSVGYQLDNLRNYFSDLPSGETDPYFVRKITASEAYSSTTPNPDSTSEEELPPLVTGKSENREKFVTIVRNKPPEIYLESEKNHNAQGPSLANSAGLEYSQLVAGRPNPQARLQIFSGSNPNYRNPNQPRTKYYLNTPNSLSTIPNPETLSFKGVSNPSTGRLAAQTLVSIENSKAVRVTLEVRRNPNYQVGDRIWWRGYLWWILSIDETYKISKNQLNWTTFRLELSKLVNVPVSLTTKK